MNKLNALLLISFIICSNAMKIKQQANHKMSQAEIEALEEKTIDAYVEFRENMDKLADATWNESNPEGKDIPLDVLVQQLQEKDEDGSAPLLTHEKAKALLTLVDANGDGKIDAKEFRHFFYVLYSISAEDDGQAVSQGKHFLQTRTKGIGSFLKKVGKALVKTVKVAGEVTFALTKPLTYAALKS